MEYLSLILFTVSTCVTPGPNNMMVMASGVNYGFRRSLPHMIGINIGFPLMVVAVGLGAGSVFRQFPELHTILKAVGAVYLLYLAYRIATAPTGKLDAEKAKPFTLLQAALFQLVNPKAWIMAVGAIVTYSVASESYFSYFTQVLIIAFIFLVFGTPCTGVWIWFGSSLKRVLSKPGYLRTFNVGMASLLAASLIPIFRELYSALVHSSPG